MEGGGPIKRFEKKADSFSCYKINLYENALSQWNFNYNIEGILLAAINQQQDLTVLISSNLEWDVQVNDSCKKANRYLGYISGNFRYFPKIQYCRSCTAPHLEYVVQFWSLHIIYIVKLECIQHCATKLIPKLRPLSYEDSNKELRLTTLKPPK